MYCASAPLPGKRQYDVSVRARRHQPGQQLDRGNVAAITTWQGDLGIGDGVLVVDGNHRKPLTVAHVA